MTGLPVPLGVRIYTIEELTERWVTRFVEDIQFRSVIPGGFASATITLRLPRGRGSVANPDPLGFPQLAELFGRVQVVDLRSAEIVWEGRIEDPARQVDPDTWQIGALGSMVTASDIQRPVFYIDTSLEHWTPSNRIDGATGAFLTVYVVGWDNSKDDDSRTLTMKFNTNYAVDDVNPQYGWRWDSHGFDQPIGRFTTTHNGNTSNGPQNANTVVLLGIASNTQVDVTTYSTSSAQTKTNTIGTDFTDANTRFIVFGTRRATGASLYQPSAGEVMQQTLQNPKVLGLRQDRTGTYLTTAANYPTDYVTVAQVVEDIVGRFLVGGWFGGTLNIPYPGSVRSQDVYIDSTDTTQILHLVYPNGATAADILNDMVSKVQENAYWAIWESKWTAYDSTAPRGFRFEYATWPANWGYLATSQDGFEGQPNGDDVYNFSSFRYPDSGDANQYHVLTAWHGNEMAPELLTGGFTRAATVGKDDPTDGTTAAALGTAFLNGKKVVQNAGTLTVRRPIQFYDAGVNGWSGGGRLLDPWMIRPGKLVRIADLPPRQYERDVTWGANAPSQSLNGAIFRVVATDYNSSDNSCRMELDQVTRWQLPTQIAATGGGTKTIRIQ